jgi:ribosomal protein S18 acetylase RimI-like enzyme
MARTGSVALRRANLADAPAIARILRTSRDAAMPWLPALHDAEQDLDFVATRMLPDATVWVAEAEGAVLGFVARRDGWVEHLYLDPRHRRRGLGSALLSIAREGETGLRLWCFEPNTAARAFYEARGFQAVDRTDGTRNEENEPDVLYAWPAGTRTANSEGGTR